MSEGGSRRRTGWIAGGAVVLVLIGVVIGVIASSSSTSGSGTTTSSSTGAAPTTGSGSRTTGSGTTGSTGTPTGSTGSGTGSTGSGTGSTGSGTGSTGTGATFLTPKPTPLPAVATSTIVPTYLTPATPLPSKAQQISVLGAALAYMQGHYSELGRLEPGPVDVFDYGVGQLWKKGIDGAGTTVAVIEGWRDPLVANVVDHFSRELHLPEPVLETIYPSGDGKLPPRCPPGMVKLGSYGSCAAWAYELELDVMSVHLMAPYARILISVTPSDSEIVDDAASQVAPPEMMEAVEAIATAGLANVISISDGTAESSYSGGKPEILAQDPGELAAAAAGIPLLVASGDSGVLQVLPSFDASKVTSGPASATWDDSPWVTAVGGSIPNFGAGWQRRGTDALWPAAGAGLSAVFARPSYQDGVASITDSEMRSVPDLTMDSTVGTSEAAPSLAGVLALATQLNGANVGPINPVLYGVLGPKGTADGIVDVIHGNNSDTNPRHRVRGFYAAKGFDIASGWGTIFAPLFVPSLVDATTAAGEDSSVRADARSQLAALGGAITLSSSTITASQSTTLRASGFLPRHPVRLSIGGALVATLHADAAGDVSFTIDPSSLRLGSGTHQIALASMLVIESTQLSVS